MLMRRQLTPFLPQNLSLKMALLIFGQALVTYHLKQALAVKLLQALEI